MELYRLDINDCQEAEIFWDIVKRNGENEIYIVANHDEYPSGRHETMTDKGLSFEGSCYYHFGLCDFQLTVTPTDLRYNEAQITDVVHFPECYNTSNTTNTTTLRIQG